MKENKRKPNHPNSANILPRKQKANKRTWKRSQRAKGSRIDLYSERNLRLTITVQNKAFLRYDNKEVNNRILIFASDTQLHWLSEATRIHGDGTF